MRGSFQIQENTTIDVLHSLLDSTSRMFLYMNQMLDDERSHCENFRNHLGRPYRHVRETLRHISRRLTLTLKTHACSVQCPSVISIKKRDDIKRRALRDRDLMTAMLCELREMKRVIRKLFRRLRKNPEFLLRCEDLTSFY